MVVRLQSSDPLSNLSMIYIPGGSLSRETAQRFHAMCPNNQDDAEVYAISEEE